MVLRIVSPANPPHPSLTLPPSRPARRLGYLALGTESTLPIPQFIANARRRSCHGLSDLTVLFWLLGDLFKTAYFFVRGNPWQFRITAVVTVLWDLGAFWRQDRGQVLT